MLLQEYLERAKNVVFFGGAGVSTESGIPDFRGENGLYKQKFDYPAEVILSHSFFEAKPEEFYRFYRERMLCPEAKPNLAHLRLAEWEKKGKLSAVITQNIDGLHTAAGSRTVYELHGSVKRNYCRRCGAFYSEEFIAASRGVPHCETCGGIVKPDVVLYEEALDEETMMLSVAALRRADLLLVAGTSLTVFPAAGLLNEFQGDHLILINRDATSADARADLVLREKVGTVLGEIRL